MCLSCYVRTITIGLSCYSSTGACRETRFQGTSIEPIGPYSVDLRHCEREPRPQRGWLRAIREGLGLTLDNVGARLGQSRKRIQEFEDAEADDRITLKSLRRVASALDCELVYAVVPKSGTIAELAERRARSQATQDVLSRRANHGSRKSGTRKRRPID